MVDRWGGRIRGDGGPEAAPPLLSLGDGGRRTVVRGGGTLGGLQDAVDGEDGAVEVRVREDHLRPPRGKRSPQPPSLRPRLSGTSHPRGYPNIPLRLWCQ